MAHYSVLLHEVVDGLDIREGDVVIDGTINGGGHSLLILEKLGKEGTLVGFDLDQSALEKAQARLTEKKLPASIHFVNENFRNLDVVIQRLHISAPDKILFDLGWSRNQIEEGNRGFTFQKDEPLTMTYLTSPGESDITAEMILNEWKEETIADILFGYGEEQFARRIANAVVTTREKTPIKTTGDFVRIIESAVPVWYRKRRIHPATKSFQALRIAVNDELGSLREGLTKAIEVLTPGGRLAIISFHSTEDRIVKNMFRESEREGLGNVLTKKPIIPTDTECQENPASRSAKLRIFQKRKS